MSYGTASLLGSVPPIIPSGATALVGGPSSSTDRAIAIWNGTTGSLLQNSYPTISAGGSLNMNGGGLNGNMTVAVRTTTPISLSANNGMQVNTNEGATALIVHNLPAAAVGVSYTFVVQDADGIRVVADTGDTIRIAGSVSAAAGRIDSTTVGSTVTLLAINATEWVSIATNGTWTVT